MFKYLQRKNYEKREKEWIKDYEEELLEIQRRKEKHGETPELCLREGDLLLFSNKDEEAIEKYKMLVEKDGVPNYIKAAAYERIGNLLQNINHLTEAIKLDKKPEYLYNRASLAVNLLSENNPPEQNRILLNIAEQDLTECIKKEPDFFAYYELRAIVRTKKGDHEIAASDIIEGFKNAYSSEDEELYFFSKGWKLIASHFDDELRKTLIKEINEIKKLKK